MSKTLRFGSVLLAVLALSNCASYDTPDNLEPVAAGDGYQAQYRTPDVSRGQAQFLRSADINASKCRPWRGGAGGKGGGIAAGVEVQNVIPGRRRGAARRTAEPQRPCRYPHRR